MYYIPIPMIDTHTGALRSKKSVGKENPVLAKLHNCSHLMITLDEPLEPPHFLQSLSRAII